jgi:hypothetical protein
VRIETRVHTYVYSAHIEGKGITGIICDITHIIAPIEDGCHPMRDGGPNTNPDHKGRVKGDIMELYDVVNGVVEEGDETSYADNGQWLRREKAEHQRCESRREKRFVDTIET